MTPYELRLDVVKMAKDMVENEHRTKMSEYQNEVSVIQSTMLSSMSMNSGITPQTALSEMRKLTAPRAPTAEEVVARATALYGFVTKKD